MNTAKPLEAKPSLATANVKYSHLIVVKDDKSKVKQQAEMKPQTPEYYYDFVGIAG